LSAKVSSKVTARIGGIAIALVCLLILGISEVLNPKGKKPFILITLVAMPIFASGIVEDLTNRLIIKYDYLPPFSPDYSFYIYMKFIAFV
jgi:hypothetical protein